MLEIDGNASQNGRSLLHNLAMELKKKGGSLKRTQFFGKKNVYEEW